MDLRNIIKKARNLIRKPYVFIPPCPNCGSRATGYYVRECNISEWQISEALRNGELVRPARDKRNTAFCLDCDFEWPEYTKTEWFTLDEIKEEKEARMTEPLLREIRQELRAERRREKGGLFNYRKFNGKF